MMNRFDVIRTIRISAPASEVWRAVTEGNAGWLWPMNIELREGGAISEGGTVTEWNPPLRVATSAQGPDGWFNELTYSIRPVPGGFTELRYEHSGMAPEGAEPGIAAHTDFYLDALRRYVENFNATPIAYAAVDADSWGIAADALERVEARLGIPAEAEVGDEIVLAGPLAGVRVMVDYRSSMFLGLRSETAMYRFFGRQLLGGVLALVVHEFSPGRENRDAEVEVRRILNDLG